MAPNEREKVTKDFTKLNETLWVLYAPPAGQPTMDIVFFHGLQWGAFEDAFWKTWLLRDSKHEIWPRKWLSTMEGFSQARMLSVSYNSCATKTDGQLHMYTLAENLITDIILAQEANVGQDCPVILVGHSWGGLVIKRLVVAALHRRSILQNNIRASPVEIERITRFLNNIRGVYYYATPHNGSRLADLGRKVIPNASPILDLLGTLNEHTAEINSDFNQQRKVPASAVAEGLDTSYGTFFPFKARVVEIASARYDIDDFYVNTNANHFDVCKAEDPKSPVIRKLAQFILQKCLVSSGEGVALPSVPSSPPGRNQAGTSNEEDDLEKRYDALKKKPAVPSK